MLRLNGGYRIVGDVDFNDVLDKVSYIPPVPGEVEPMTISSLLYKTCKLAFEQNNFSFNLNI